MEDERLTKRICKSDTRGDRGAGRPPMRWSDCVRKALDNRGMTVDQAREVVTDRNEWRMLVNR